MRARFHKLIRDHTNIPFISVWYQSGCGLIYGTGFSWFINTPFNLFWDPSILNLKNRRNEIILNQFDLIICMKLCDYVLIFGSYYFFFNELVELEILVLTKWLAIPFFPSFVCFCWQKQQGLYKCDLYIWIVFVLYLFFMYFVRTHS